MPNWCSNYLDLTHSNPQMITRAINALKRGEFLQEFVPCPKELKEAVAGSFADEAEQKKLEDQHKSNSEKFGYPTWYEFCVSEWGTKWDVESNDIYDQTEISFSANFDSAWAPPVNAMEKLSDLGFEVRLCYYEPGMGFCGKYTTEYGDHTYEINKGDEIPEDLDEMFGISENSWDEDEEEQ